MAKKKKSSKTTWIVGGFIIFVMVGSGFGAMFGSYTSSRKKVRYNDFVFVPIDDRGYRVKIDDRIYDFEYTPDQIKDLEIEKSITDQLRNTAEIDITYDYESDAAQMIALLSFQLKEGYLRDLIYVKTGADKENKYNHSIITCSDSTDLIPVIYFKLGNETRITKEDKCIILEASKINDFEVLRDRLVYSILGVMD